MDFKRLGKNHVDIKQMTLQEVSVAIEWARQEGWNPGIHDAECFYYTDPNGFFAAKLGGEIVGTVSAVKYSDSFAFLGFYIVRPDMRGNGVGAALNNFINNYCKGFNLGIDGVLHMQATYERRGYKFAHKNIRYAGTAQTSAKISEHCIPICKNDFSQLTMFDSKFFPAERLPFLRHWLFQKDAHAFMIKNEAKISGYGVIRKCFQGHKVGPLFASTFTVASELLETLLSTVPGEEVFLDVPDPNTAAVELAKKNGMHPVFATARMYTKQTPALPLKKIYGLTSFELG